MNISQVWPEWTEECLLGEGSFGKVYRAKREEYGRTFYSAIKVLKVPKNQQEVQHIKAQGMSDADVYNYFRGVVDSLLNEITLMDNLKGAKNVVGIEDYKIIERQNDFGWDIFIRMELLTPFDSFVSNPDFSQRDVLKLGIDICSALEICEQNAILHRDIKPDNIFISRFGEYKLGDFGIARKLESTQSNFSRKGTLNYMAPEVYKSEEYGPAVDLYSLGLVLYTLLNNNRTAFLPPYPQPIAYKDSEEALAKRLSGMPLPLPCNASADLGAVIVKACAYSPWDRYSSAAEFKNALIAQWNALLQSGENQSITTNGQSANAYGYPLQHTTNDMTANGYVVAGGYVQETTVLDDGPAAQGYQSVGAEPEYARQLQPTRKGSTLCRFLTIPLMIALCVIAFSVLLGDENFGGLGYDIDYREQLIGNATIFMGIVALVANRNKISVGVWTILLSSYSLILGCKGFFDETQMGLPLENILTIIEGALLFFGGLVMICQKEVRLGGQLCLYAMVPQWLYRIYMLIYKDYEVTRVHILMTVASVALFVWAYGYTKTKHHPVKLVFHIIGYVITLLAGILTVKTAWMAITVGVVFVEWGV